MFVTHGSDWPGPGGEPRLPADPLPAPLRDLLWCLRRTAQNPAMHAPACMARDQHVHLLLQRRFGDSGLGLEHLLRCLVIAIARRATRPVLLHRPCRPQISADEWRLITALGEAGRPARVAAVLAPLAGRRAGELQPLLAGIAALLPR